MAINKIIYGGNVLIDLTADTVSKETLLSGATAHDKSGAIITGTCDYDANTQNATAGVAEVLLGKTFYGQGAEKTGTMPNNGGNNVTITSVNGASIPLGFYDGSGKAVLSAADINALQEGNIKAGITILGKKGTYTGASINAQSKTVTPTKDGFSVSPDSGYDYLSSVTVSKIPYVESANAYGTTVTIA